MSIFKKGDCDLCGQYSTRLVQGICQKVSCTRACLPYDFARCSAETQSCKFKAMCVRYTCKGNKEGSQANMDASDQLDKSGLCDMFIRNRGQL